MTEPANNPLKLPFFLLCAAIGVVVAAVGLGYGTWWLAVFGLAFAAVAVVFARVVKQERNPWWMRSPLDGRWPRAGDRRRGA